MSSSEVEFKPIPAKWPWPTPAEDSRLIDELIARHDGTMEGPIEATHEQKRKKVVIGARIDTLKLMSESAVGKGENVVYGFNLEPVQRIWGHTERVRVEM